MIAPARPVVLSCVVVLGLALAGAGGVFADSPDEAKADPKADPKAARKADAKDEPAAQAVSPFLAATRSAGAATGDAVVITNDDLSKLSGGGVYVVTPAIRPGSEDAPAGDAAPEAPEGEDPLVWMERRRAEAGDRAEARTEAEKRVAELEQRIADLERRRLAVRNPLLARPEAPSEDERQEGERPWNDLDGQQRVERTDADLERARAELAEARAALGDR